MSNSAYLFGIACALVACALSFLFWSWKSKNSDVPFSLETTKEIHDKKDQPAPSFQSLLDTKAQNDSDVLSGKTPLYDW